MPSSYQNRKAVKFYIEERQRTGWRNRGERVVKFAKIKPGSYILDLCCGPGFVLKVIRERVGNKGRIIGIDSSLNLIKYADRICHFKNVLFKCGNIENLDKYIDNQKFDFVIILASWNWVKNKNKIFLKVRKVLKPDGKFVFSLTGDNLYHPLTKKFSGDIEKI